MTSYRHLSFAERAQLAVHPIAKQLLNLAQNKQTNLALSVDFTRADEILTLAEKLGSEICVLKTHIDIVEDFSWPFIKELREIANKFQFLLFEDRKFADIGNTVKLQFTKGVYQIAKWADIVNAHALPGPGQIKALKEGITERACGLLLLAQMSSSGNLIDVAYTQACVELAIQHQDAVIGFIAQERLTEATDFIYLTPGVGFSAGGDQLGQNYRDPEQAIYHAGNDIVIVGRPICQMNDSLSAAQQMRQLAWQAYLKRLRKV